MRISVITPSRLDSFDGAAPHRKQYFIRAVDSFLLQSFKDAELVIGSDGCSFTNDIVRNNYKKELQSGKIKLLELERRPLFTGALRQEIISNCSGEILVNLDGDDFFLPHHLKSITVSFNREKYDWVYFNYYIRPNSMKSVNVLVDVPLQTEKMNNACYAWRRGLDVTWGGCDGRQDNKLFIAQLIKFPKAKKIYGTGYCLTNVQIEKR